jgi:hypothetical protein
LAYWQKEHHYNEFEPCFGPGKYNCLTCRREGSTHTYLTWPIEGRSKLISNIRVPIESKGDGQKSPLSKIQKPYDFARAKINFSMEDLENSSEGDDWNSDSFLPVSNSSP